MQDNLSIAIVGGGLAGLLAAIRLGRDGHSVQVFERRESLSDRGGGLMIRPNAIRHLVSWQMEQKFEAVSLISKRAVMRNLSTGEDIEERHLETYSPYPTWILTRQDAQKVIFEEAQATERVEIRFGVDVSDIREDPCAVVLRDGSVIASDLVIVADGVRSRLRKHVLGSTDPSLEPVVSGMTSYQTNLPLKVTESIPQTSSLDSEDGATYIWRDQGRHVISGSSPSIHIADFIINESDRMSESDKDGKLWDEIGDINYVRQVYHDVAPSLQTWLSLVKKCSRWKLCYLPDLPRWRSEGGKLILLGDAAHAMLPSAAQGLSQIVEDVAALSYLLRPDGKKDKATALTTKPISNIGAATKVWQDFRIPRVERIKALAGSTQSRYQSKPNEEPRDSRPPPQSVPTSDDSHPTAIEPDMDAKFTSPAFLKWQYDYDLVTELDDFLGKL